MASMAISKNPTQNKNTSGSELYQPLVRPTTIEYKSTSNNIINKHRQHAQYNRGQQPNPAIYQSQKDSIKGVVLVTRNQSPTQGGVLDQIRSQLKGVSLHSYQKNTNNAAIIHIPVSVQVSQQSDSEGKEVGGLTSLIPDGISVPRPPDQGLATAGKKKGSRGRQQGKIHGNAFTEKFRVYQQNTEHTRTNQSQEKRAHPHHNQTNKQHMQNRRVNSRSRTIYQ
jgi:hypothetical protein